MLRGHERQAFRQAAKFQRCAPKQRPLRINIAGVPCTAWSSMGSQARFGHGSERPHAVWLAERKVVRGPNSRSV